MKFDPSWRQVALLAVLLAAVIVSHLIAPLAVAAVTSMASTIVGALFVNLQPKPDPSVPPTLRSVNGGLSDEGKQ